jgi:hypothetical protein
VAEGVSDADGWRYGWNVTETNWKSRIELQHTVRFRTWKRQIVFDPVAFLAGTEGTCESSEGSSGRSVIRRSLQLWENERWVIFAGFASAHLLPTDPPHFQSTKGNQILISLSFLFFFRLTLQIRTDLQIEIRN